MTGVVCREMERKSKGRVRDMIGDIGERSEHASGPFTLLKSVFDKALLHLDVKCFLAINVLDMTVLPHILRTGIDMAVWGTIPGPWRRRNPKIAPDLWCINADDWVFLKSARHPVSTSLPPVCG